MFRFILELKNFNNILSIKSEDDVYYQEVDSSVLWLRQPKSRWHEAEQQNSGNTKEAAHCSCSKPARASRRRWTPDAAVAQRPGKTSEQHTQRQKFQGLRGSLWSIITWSTPFLGWSSEGKDHWIEAIQPAPWLCLEQCSLHTNRHT